MKRIVMVIMCVVMSLVMFGCGQSNEQKYMSLRKEVESDMNAFSEVVRAIPDHRKEQYAPSRERFREQYLPHHEKALEEIKKIQKRVMPKIEEMKKLSDTDVKLKSDYENFGRRKALILENAIKAETRIINNYK